MTEWFWNFLFYSFFGYLLERLFAAAARSDNQTRRCLWLLPLCPVYGLAITAVLASPPAWKEMPWLPFTAGVITTGVEYAVHWVYETWLRVRFWDYTGLPLQWHGRICFLFSLAWGVLAAVAVRFVQPQLDILIPRIPPGFTVTALLLLTADGLITVRYLTVTGDVTFTARRGA